MQERLVISIMLMSIACSALIHPVHAEDAVEWYTMGENAVLVGDYPSASIYYNNALALDRSYAGAYSGKALVLNQLGNYAGALDSADQALAIKVDTRALRERAYALYKLGRYSESVTAYDTFFTFQTNLADTYCTQGMAYDELNQKEKAIGAFDRCAALDPKNLNALNRKGLALMSLGRYDEALDAFSQCTRISIDNAEVWNNKGIAYWAVGDYNNALVCFKRALNIDPAFTDAKQNLEKIYAQEPFGSMTGISLPAVSATTRIPSTPPVPVQTPDQILPPVTTIPVAEIPTGLPPESRTPYAPLTPFAPFIGIAIAFTILFLDKYRN